jgi:cytochrome P450
MIRDPLRFCADATRELGDVYRIDVGPKTLVMVSHPEHLKYVLQDNSKNFVKGTMWEGAKRVMGNGIAMTEGDLWLRQRRLMQPAFHRDRLAALVDTIVAAVDDEIGSWAQLAQRGRPVDLSTELVKLTGDIMLRTLFGRNVRRQTLDTLMQAFETVRRSLGVAMWTSMLGNRFPMPGRRRLAAAFEVVDAVVTEVTNDRARSRNGSAQDLLGMLLDARDVDSGDAMSPQQLRDEIVALFFAGHETTAVGMAWTLYALTQHADAAEKVEAEVRHVLPDGRLTRDSISKLTYTRMVFEESLRFYPAGWVIPREAYADDEIGGYRVPAKSLVLICPAVTHRHPKYYQRPESFTPEHFAPDVAAARSRYAFVPFGAGPRQCIGMGLSLVEAQVIIATIASRYRLRLAHPVTPRPVNVQLHPKPHLEVYLERLPSSAAAVAATTI